MRKTILTTAAIAFVALGTALGVVKSEEIKTFFASENLYQKDAAAQTASATTPTSSTDVAALSDQTNAAVATAQTSADTTTTASATQTTPSASEDTSLNNQTPSAGDDKTDAAATPAAATPEATTAPAESGDMAAAIASGAAADPTIGGTAAVTDAAKKDEPAAKTYTFKVDLPRALKDREVGSKSAPITIYDFSSLTCPHCAYFHKEIYPKVKANYIDTGKVRWVFRGFPLNDAAMKAEMIARCAPEDQYEKLIDLMFSNQDRWAFTDSPLPNLNMLVRLAGVNDDMFQACTNNKDLEAALAAAIQTNGDKYKVAATPTFVFNDGAKNFAGAGTYEGFALDIDQLLKTLTTPKMTVSPKLESKEDVPAENPLAPKE